MFEKNGIQNKIRKLITRIIISFALISGVLFYIFTYTQISEKYSHEAAGVINLTNLILETTFKDSENALSSYDSFLNSQINIKDESLINKSLEIFIKNISSANTLFIGNSNGDFFLFPKRYVAKDYDPRIRPWYVNSIEEPEKINWTEPYVDHGTGEFTITASKRVNDNMVIGVDILLSEITNIVKSEKIGNNGFITIVSGSGNILASKDADLLAKNWDETNISSVSFSQILENKESHDSNYLYISQKIDGMDIVIIGAISQKEILESMLFMFFLITFITIMVVVFAERIAVKYSDKIVNPILSIVGTMEKVEDGNFDLQCEAESNDFEVAVLVNGFNSMMSSINEKNIEMQALYEELYASEETLQEQYDLLYENKIFIEESEQRYKSIFEASEEGLWDIDKDGSINYLTPSWYDNFDIDISKSTLKSWFNLIHPEERQLVENKLKLYKDGKIDNYRIEYRILTKSGTYIWIEAVGISKYKNGVFVSMSGSHQNITSRKQYELKIQNMAYRDTLTKLHNRAYFEENYKDYFESGMNGALLLLDIDNFKYINDIHGHSFGDEILRQFSERLSDVVKNYDKSIVARYSGNEFIILLDGIDEKDQIKQCVTTICKAVETPFIINTSILKITASIGITIFPKDGCEIEQLIQNADIAMYHARRVLKKSYYFFDNNIKQNAINEMNFENYLRTAIDLDEFEVYYQPIMSIKNRNIKGFEALIRWNSKALGFIMPDQFIPLTEKTGLINEIGLIVLEKACQFISNLNKQLSSNMTMSVNISVIQLMEDNFVNRVLSIIDRYELAHESILLEITESITLESNENVIAKLFYLRNQKIGISLDDFGTGYSSFKNLIRLPINNIKIDKAIMKDSMSNEHVYNLLESVVDFAHKINISVVAEGIEDLVYLERSENMKVDYVQGYYFSKPKHEDEIIELIEDLNKLCLQDKE